MGFASLEKSVSIRRRLALSKKAYSKNLFELAIDRSSVFAILPCHFQKFFQDWEAKSAKVSKLHRSADQKFFGGILTNAWTNSAAGMTPSVSSSRYDMHRSNK